MLQTAAPPLTARRIAVTEIDAPTRAAMFALFARYYADVSEKRFAADLEAKQFALLLEDTGRIAGFTTARVFDFAHGGETCRIVFSGDTIVAREHWGQQTLARAWLGEMGRIARMAGDRPLYWFLIAKGHRTWRYLPAFARSFAPSPGGEDDPGLLALRDALAAAMFGPAFDPASGVIRFAEPQGRLSGPWAEPTARERRRDDVRFFLSANPGYGNGDELACLTAITPENMRPLARRWFDAGGDG